jgi:hypothetical protein
MFPDHPVAVGDFWNATAKYDLDMPPKKGDAILQWFRLDSVKTVNGRPIAHLTLSYAAVTHEDGGSVRVLEASGTALVDLDRGAVTEESMTGTYTLQDSAADSSDKSDAPGDNPASVTGTYEQHMTVTYSDPK